AFWCLRGVREWFGGTGLKTLSQQALNPTEQTLHHKLQTLSHTEQTLSQTERALSRLERTASEGGPYNSSPDKSRPDKTGGVGDRRRRGKRMRRRIRKCGLRSTP